MSSTDTGGLPEAEVQLAGLLEEMTSLQALAGPATVPFSAHMTSSYDRAARTPEAAEWFANYDRGYYLRRDGDEHVLMETSGPGVITRIWSANPSGTLRIYLDGAERPTLEAPMAELLSGQARFGEPLAYVAARGHNLYAPIAFQAGARVTATADDLYYHVNFRRYANTTPVESLTAGGSTRQDCLYAAAADDLQAAQSAPLPSGSFETSSDTDVWVALAAAEEPGALTWLELVPERVDAAYLRGTALELRFDGHQTVKVPLGDFFGSGPGLTDSESLALSMTSDGVLTSRFIMPFERTMDLRVRTLMGEGGVVRGRYRVAPRPDVPTWYFHAGWTGPREHDVMEPRDMTLVRLSGQGHYVGMVLNVANPDAAWWGEGDEKIYVDDERFPSHFGTGTEDYFGFAWCSTQRYATAFIGQTRANPANQAGYLSMYRVHMLDRIPFTRAFRFDLEALHWATGQRSVRVSYDALYYWYGPAGSSDLSEPPPDRDWVIPQLPAGTVQPAGEGHVSCG